MLRPASPVVRPYSKRVVEGDEQRTQREDDSRNETALTRILGSEK